MSGALAGLTVLDLSRILAGPWATQILADLGADVIKIERPGEGDDTRHWGPPYLRDADGAETAEAAYFLAANRSKRSLTLDFTAAAGQDIVRRLAAGADIFIENYKVGGLAKYGLGYADLAAVNPRLIYCSITGFGQTGPYRDRPGYDYMIQGMAGFMSITGQSDQTAGGGPMRAGVAVADILTGMYAAVAILAALQARTASGSGQHIDLALLDCMAASLANQNMNYLVSGDVPGRIGNAHPNIVPYQPFATSDGHVIVAVGNDAQFRRLCVALEADDLGRDPRLADNAGRVAHRDTLVAHIGRIMATRPSAEWHARLGEAEVPCGPINDIAETLADPQIKARGLVAEVAHALAGSLRLVGSPMRLSQTPTVAPGAPPLLGEHSDAILRERLGLDADAIAALRRKGVI